MPTIQKTYQYKVYRAGVYLGLLPNVVSEFATALDINTFGVGLAISVAANADVAGNPVGYLLAENGDYLNTESGDRITLERDPDIVGNASDDILIRNGNTIKVYEFSDTYPNGKLMFNGRIFSWDFNFGSQDSVIEIQTYSDGMDMGNYLIDGGSQVLDQSQTTHDSDAFLGTPIIHTSIGEVMAGQTFTTGGSTTNLSKIILRLARYYNTSVIPVTVEVWANVSDANAGTSPLASVTKNIAGDDLDTFGGAAFAEQEFIFAPSLVITVNTQYFLTVRAALDESNQIRISTTSVDAIDHYTGGNSWYRNMPTDWASNFAYFDFYFKTYSSTDAVTAIFSNYDPANIVKEIVDSYVSRGGLIDYDTGTIDLTGLSVSYTFKTATIKEGVEKALSLAPSTWYFYVDPGNNTLYFKETATVANYTIVRGRDIISLNLKATIEYVKNAVYFVGGDTGAGSNLLKYYSDDDSRNNYGQQLGVLSDNRVTLSGTADAIGESYIDEFKDEKYTTTVDVLDGIIDITTIKPGQLVSFAGFGGFVDNLLLQVVRVEYSPHSAKLTLGILPKRQIIDVSKLSDAIAALQTVDNPNAAG